MALKAPKAPEVEEDPQWIAIALAILGIGAIVGGVYYLATQNDDGGSGSFPAASPN
jgi:hypothetical protein